MEQNATNKEVSFWNRWSTVLSCVGLAIVVYLAYNSWWVPRQECASKVQYNPANSITTEGYYTIGANKSFTYSDTLRDSDRKFKTREEAISQCMQIK